MKEKPIIVFWCSACALWKDGKWKTKLEEPLQFNQVVMLLSLGDVKYDILSYLKAHSNIQILECPLDISRKEKNDLD